MAFCCYFERVLCLDQQRLPDELACSEKKFKCSMFYLSTSK